MPATAEAARLTPDELDQIIQLIPGYDPTIGAEEHGYWFDYDAAAKAVEFFPTYLVHLKGPHAGKPFVLEPWEQAIVANLFGWKDGEGLRRYSECLLFVARKNGKTTLGAGIAIYMLLMDDEDGAEIYSLAAEADQAGIVFRTVSQMIAREPVLDDMVTRFKYHIERRDDPMSCYKYVSGKADTKHGYSTHCAIFDELHVCTRELVEVIDTSLGSRAQPLILYMTTSDFERISVCNDMHARATIVRDDPVQDMTFLPCIFEVPRQIYVDNPDCWKDESLWPLANPALGTAKSMARMRKEAAKAEIDPASLNAFLRLQLNIRTETEGRLLNMDKWNACGPRRPLSDYEGKQVTGAALDLGATSDLTALCLEFANPDGGYDYFWWGWMPEDKAHEKERKHKAKYTTWARQGLVSMTPGDETDYQFVRRDINELGDRFGIPVIVCDRLFQGAQLCQDLASDGFKIYEWGQGFLDMAAATLEFTKLVGRGELHHGDNEMARWQAANLMVKLDAAGNMKPDKDKSQNKIDYMVTSIGCIFARLAKVMPHIDSGEVVYGGVDEDELPEDDDDGWFDEDEEEEDW